MTLGQPSKIRMFILGQQVSNASMLSSEMFTQCDNWTSCDIKKIIKKSLNFKLKFLGIFHYLMVSSWLNSDLGSEKIEQ